MPAKIAATGKTLFQHGGSPGSLSMLQTHVPPAPITTPPITAPIIAPFLSESRDDCIAGAGGCAAIPIAMARSEMISFDGC